MQPIYKLLYFRHALNTGSHNDICTVNPSQFLAEFIIAADAERCSKFSQLPANGSGHISLDNFNIFCLPFKAFIFSQLAIFCHGLTILQVVDAALRNTFPFSGNTFLV